MDSQLVDKIVQMVLAAMKQQGLAAASVPTAAAIAANVTKPAGEANATKSADRISNTNGKFAGSIHVESFKPSWQRPARKESASRNPSRVFITADMLLGRLAISGNGTLELAANEFLTPNAADMADRKHVTIRQSNCPSPHANCQLPKPPSAPQASAPSAVMSPPAQGNSHVTAKAVGLAGQIATGPSTGSGRNSQSLGLLIDRPDAKVESLLAALQHDSTSLLSFNQASCPISNLRSMCAALAVGQVQAAVAILPYAADALVLANKVKGVRAVQGTQLASVQSAIRHVGANLLILEHAFSTFHEMRSMVRAFAAPRAESGLAQSVLAAISELERSS